MASEIKFTQDTMKQFNVAKSFSVNKDRINAMNFSLDGETLISSSDDDSIVIYDCKEGEYVLISFKNKNIIFLYLSIEQNERYLVKNMVLILYILFMELNKFYMVQLKLMVCIFDE
jgi:WD40 repeat protein